MLTPKNSLIGKLTQKILLVGKLNIGKEEVYPVLQEKQATPTEQIQNIVADDGIYGLSKVVVNPIPSEYIVPSGEVAITENGTYDITNLASAIVDVDFITQTKTATPTKQTQEILPDNGKDGLSKVTINPIPNEYIIPSGSETITENGTYDITDKASVEVNVSGGGGGDYNAKIESPLPTGTVNAYTCISKVNMEGIGLTQMRNTFMGWTGLKDIINLDSSNVTEFYYAFTNCDSLVNIPSLDTSKASDFRYMFSGCSSLQNLPSIDFTSLTGYARISSMFNGCTSLSNQSLKNILAALVTTVGRISGGASNKNLKYIGLTSTQATTCTGFTEWAALSANGWTTGY